MMLVLKWTNQVETQCQRWRVQTNTDLHEQDGDRALPHTRPTIHCGRGRTNGIQLGVKKANRT